MNKDKLSRIIGELDDRIVSESAGARISSGRSETVPEKKRRGIGRWIEAAACLLIVTGMIGAAVILPSLTKKSGPAGAVTGEDSNSDLDFLEVMNIVEWLDGLGFDPEMSEDEFSNILKSYSYNGKSVYEKLDFMTFDTTSGGGTEGHSRWFSSFYGFEVNDSVDEWYIEFESSVNTEGFTLPENVCIGDSFNSVCSAFSLREVSVNELKRADSNGLELYKKNNYSVTVTPMPYKEPDAVPGYVLKFSYVQDFVDDSGKNISMREEVSFSFDMDGDHLLLSKVAIKIINNIRHSIDVDRLIPISYRCISFFPGYNGNADVWNKAVVIRSKNELTEYIEERKEKNPLVVPDVEDEKLISQITDAHLKWVKDMLDFSDSYSDEYFETHDLIVLPIEAASGSFRFMLSSLVRQEAGVVTAVVNTYMPEVYTDDLREFCWLIETGEKLGADETVEVSFRETDDTVKASYFRVGVYDDDCTEPKCTLIRSREELEKHLQRYLENSDELDAMKETLDRYTDDYFKTNYLAMVGVSVGSGSYRLNVRSLLNDWSGIEVMLETVTEKGADVTADEASWTVIIEGEGILPDDIKASVRSDFREVESEEFEQYR